MILFYILYRSTEGDERKRYVVASTEDNAWAALQAADPQATSIESIGETDTNLVIGS
jgi:hypothetical protein